jgi:L-ascorbate metabolism protein UlaG (beta-lactamase superfamily)
MIAPALKDEAFLADVRAARGGPGFRLWWLGQAGFLLQHEGGHALLDPYLSDSLTAKYAATDKPHVRMTERVVDPRRLDFIDVVSSSHNHTDHLDGETLRALMAANPRLAIVVPEANRAFAAERLGTAPERLLGAADGDAVQTPGGFTFHAIPAAHERLETDEAGRHRCLGYVVTFGPFAVYHAGDTVRYEGMVERLLRRPIDAALLPINGRKPERRVPGNLWGPEAAELAKEISARAAIPMHYEMFTFNTESPDAFVAACERAGQPYRVLRAGERWQPETQDPRPTTQVKV